MSSDLTTWGDTAWSLALWSLPVHPGSDPWGPAFPPWGAPHMLGVYLRIPRLAPCFWFTLETRHFAL